MGITQLIKTNRLPRKQKGQRIETPSAFYLRFYVTTPDGRKQKCVKLADRSDLYRSWKDVEPLIQQELDGVNTNAVVVTGRTTLREELLAGLDLFGRVADLLRGSHQIPR